jgi:DNA-binding MarR family transcriptional regulator
VERPPIPANGPRDEGAWRDELTRSITALSRLAQSRRLHDEMGERAGVDLRPYLFGVLSRIRELQPVRASDVAHEMGYDRSTVSRYVAELVELDCVRRRADPADGRAVILELTDRGTDVLDRVYGAWNATLGEVTAEWSAADRMQLLVLLRRFADTLGGYVTEL